MTWAESEPDGTRALGAAELLAPGEISLAAGDSYTTPTVVAAYSAAGLDGISDRFHRQLRARATHPSTPRPAVLNTWEAVYFDQNLAGLSTLADAAAAAGLERFVLDDGWFGGRRDDTTSLGDWTVSSDVWPDGLTPLIDHVTGLGLQFGLWVEPEMINADSDLYRAHPDWVLGPAGRLGPEARHQHVLDLANPDAWQHIHDALQTLLAENDIAYLKWDHNRDLVEATHAGRAGVHVQTAAVYRLFDALKAAHPGLEIESCSSGGARVDLGVLARTDRVWASDCNDALERQQIQRWTNLLLPLELIGIARRAADRAHHRPHPRAVVPGGDRAVRPLRRRVGHRVGHRRRPGRAGRGDRDLPAAAGAAAHRHRRARRPPGRRPRRCPGWSRPTARPRCSATSSCAPGRSRSRCRPASSASTRTAATP